MRISTEWLREFVDVPETGKLGHIFEMAGIGVEEMEGDTFTLEVTSNRGDCLSAVGLAREIAAMTNQSLQVPTSEPQSPELPAGQLQVTIEAPDDCPRYVGRVLENVQLGESPAWMQQRLVACGMRPVNNVVDVTNYVLLETGQPLHAFDADTIPNRHIVVRRAKPGEHMTTLDGIERELDSETLLITDGERPLAVAGVMGGSDSEVSERTTRLILESAHFTPSRVHHAAKLLGMQTEASRRFERWVDPNGAARAAERACQLLCEHAGASLVDGAVDNYPKPIRESIVALRPARCNAVLGLQLDADTMAQLLGQLKFCILQRGDDLIQISAPTWRSDIEREVDLIEEVARIHGYEHIPTNLPAGANPSAGRSLAQRLEERAKSALLRCGLQETITSSLTNAFAVLRAGLDAAASAVTLSNPVTEDATHLRTSLIPNLLESLEHNARRQARLFEIGKIYLPTETGKLPIEKRCLGLALLDAPPPTHWRKEEANLDFFSLKAAVNRLIDAMGAAPANYRAVQTAPFHPGRAARVELEGEELGVLGEVHPEVAARYDLKHRAYLAVLDFEVLVRHLSLRRQYTPLPRFPAAERDLALLVKLDVPAAGIEAVIRAAGGPLLEAVEIFDIYTGPPVPAGEKNLALSLRFRAADRTLTDQEVTALMEAIQEAAERELGARLRD